MAEKVMLELVDRGMPRDEAHEELRKASMVSLDQGVNLEVACNSSTAIMSLIDQDELTGFFKPESHLGSSSELVENAISIAKKRCS